MSKPRPITKVIQLHQSGVSTEVCLRAIVQLHFTEFKQEFLTDLEKFLLHLTSSKEVKK